MPKIIHYRNKCIGCNSCVEQAPQRWKMSQEDGKSNLIDSKNKKGVYQIDIGLDELEANEKAAKDCPVNIIRIKK